VHVSIAADGRFFLGRERAYVPAKIKSLPWHRDRPQRAPTEPPRRS
jgi:hypothetical protein